MNPYIANTSEDVKEMLKSIGVESIDDLFADIKPEFKPTSFHLPKGKSEYEVVHHLTALAQKNSSNLSLFIGAGFYDHYIPAVIHSLISRGEFLTCYTPYQPECSQGTLQSLYEYQSAICTLTEMDVANASLYDGGTALYEAIMMAIRITGRRRVIMDGGVNPIYRKMIKSYTKNLKIEFVETPVLIGQANRQSLEEFLNDKTAALILQNPNFFGAIDDHGDIIEKSHKFGILCIENVYPISLGLLKTPGEMDVDIVTGEGQSLGLPLNFGGPYLGFMATKRKYIRKMPGRIVGRTLDTKGQVCYVNTLQAREQHIRREKATSNICTNVSLCAIQSLMFMSLLGKKGFADLALLNREKSEFMCLQLQKVPGVVVNKTFPTFNEFTVRLPKKADQVIHQMMERGFCAGFPLARYFDGMEQEMLIAVTEKRSKEEILNYIDNLQEVLK